MAKSGEVYSPDVVKHQTHSKTALAISGFDIASNLYKKSREYIKNNFYYTIVVSEKDMLYDVVYDWLITSMPEERHRHLSVSSGRINHNVGYPSAVADSESEVPKIAPLVIRFDDSAEKKIKIGTYTINVHVRTPESESKRSESDPKKIIFSAPSYAAQQAVIKQIETLNNARTTIKKPKLKMVGQWNSWTTRSDLPARSMESVNLPIDQKTRVIDDLREFLEAEEHYNNLAIPWHRGYMFHGPPGTGKTSFVKALASEFSLDLWYISLSDLKSEVSLLGLLSDVGPRSILLLEDIDTMKITKERESEQGEISLSSLLNTLDGVATPHGLITMMTTNHFEDLDPALTRAGRMDLVEILDYPTISTVEQMFRHFYNKDIKWNAKYKAKTQSFTFNISTAQIAEVFKRNMKDATAANQALLALVN